MASQAREVARDSQARQVARDTRYGRSRPETELARPDCSRDQCQCLLRVVSSLDNVPPS